MKYEGFVSIANYMCCTKFCSIVANRFTCLLFVENWYIYSCKVHLPHGAVVTIANGKGKRPQFINIWLKASPADYQQTEGKGLDYFYSILLIMNLCFISITEILYDFKMWNVAFFSFSMLLLSCFWKVMLPIAKLKVNCLLIVAREEIEFEKLIEIKIYHKP